MPKRSKISVIQRRAWLNRHEAGEPQEEIATKDKVNPRTVREGIERARLERDFEVAQREQLRDALRSHQDDLLNWVDRIRQTVQVLPPDFETPHGRDFGFEALDPQPMAEDERNLRLPFNREQTTREHPLHDWSPVRVKRDVDEGSQIVELGDEDSRLWNALKEHIGAKDPIWRHLSEWRNALLAEIKARAALNQIIKKAAEKIFRERMLLRGVPNSSRLTPWLISFVRGYVTHLALGNPVTNVLDRLRVDSGQLTDNYTGKFLIERPENVDTVMANIVSLIAEVTNLEEVRHTADTYRDMEVRTKRVKGDAEGYLLLHHIPGRCSICKKLAGQ